MSRRANLRVARVLMGALLALAFLPTPPAAAGGRAPAAARVSKGGRLKELQRERLGVLREAAALMTEGYRQGQVSFEEMRKASRDVLDAELALSSSNRERIAILERAVALEKEAEAIATAQHRAGRSTSRDLLAAKAARLEAEIQLEQARARRSR